MLAALTEATVVLIADLIETFPLLTDPFDWLKARLVTAHQLTNIQHVEKLLSLRVMGQQKPSELQAEIIRICPGGEENFVFFNCLFLQKLPRELRVLLSEADMADTRLLSGQADQLWAHVQLHHDTVAVAAESDDADGAVAAEQSARGGQGNRRGGQQLRGQQCATRGAVAPAVTASLGRLVHRPRRPHPFCWPGSLPGYATATGSTAMLLSPATTRFPASGR